MKKIQLCDNCLDKLKEAASRGGKAGSVEDKRRAARAGADSRQRKAVKITYKGYSLSINDWAAKLGVSRNTIYRRIHHRLPLESVLKATV